MKKIKSFRKTKQEPPSRTLELLKTSKHSPGLKSTAAVWEDENNGPKPAVIVPETPRRDSVVEAKFVAAALGPPSPAAAAPLAPRPRLLLPADQEGLGSRAVAGQEPSFKAIVTEPPMGLDEQPVRLSLFKVEYDHPTGRNQDASPWVHEEWKGRRVMFRMVCTGMAVLWMVTAFLTLYAHAAALGPQQFVLAVYTLCFGWFLLQYEMSQSNSYWPHTPGGCGMWDKRLLFYARYFSFLFHPVWKAIYIFFGGTLFVAIHTWTLSVLVLVGSWLITATYLFFFFLYPAPMRALDMRENLPVAGKSYRRFVKRRNNVKGISRHIAGLASQPVKKIIDKPIYDIHTSQAEGDWEVQTSTSNTKDQKQKSSSKKKPSRVRRVDGRR